MAINDDAIKNLHVSAMTLYTVEQFL